jgi:hypothetical protein
MFSSPVLMDGLIIYFKYNFYINVAFIGYFSLTIFRKFWFRTFAGRPAILVNIYRGFSLSL